MEVINMEEISAETHLLLHKKVLNRFQKKIRTRTLSRISSEVLYISRQAGPFKNSIFCWWICRKLSRKIFREIWQMSRYRRSWTRYCIWTRSLDPIGSLDSCTHRISERIHYKFSDRICREGLYKTTFWACLKKVLRKKHRSLWEDLCRISAQDYLTGS